MRLLSSNVIADLTAVLVLTLGCTASAQAGPFAPAAGQPGSTAVASNDASIALFRKMGFEQWGFMPRVARLEGSEKDLVLFGRRLHEPPGAA